MNGKGFGCGVMKGAYLGQQHEEQDLSFLIGTDNGIFMSFVVGSMIVGAAGSVRSLETLLVKGSGRDAGPRGL